MDAMTFGLFAAGLLAGAATQRLTGLGFALVATPFLVLSFGPWEAVGILQICALAVCSGLTVARREHIEWRRATQMAFGAALVIAPATWFAFAAPPRLLELLIGLVLVASLALVVGLRSLPVLDGQRVRFAAGAACGIATAVAGTPGPVMTVYARVSRWSHVSFAATVQPFFVMIAVVALGARWAVAETVVPSLPSWTWVAAALSLPGGLLVGGFLERIVPERVAVGAMFVVALVGALLMVARAWSGG